MSASERSRPWGVAAACMMTPLLTGCFDQATVFEHAYVPRPEDEVGAPRRPAPAYDVMGTPVGAAEADRLLQTAAGRAALDPDSGAVAITPDLLALGRTAFYAETFGNEVVLTDILGMLDGPLTATAVGKAVLELRGRGTTNLRVVLARDALIGGRTFRKGEVIDTGIDVARGAWVPLGMKLSLGLRGVRVGITCALCHATVDPVSHKVIPGAPNNDLALGLMLALASNSAAFVAHTGVDLLRIQPRKAGALPTADGRALDLPDAATVEDAVDRDFLAWPPGFFDSMTDYRNVPTQIPGSFSWGNHPFNWSGAFMAGPFNGLSVQTNNVHGLNSDPFTQTAQMAGQFGISPDLYLAAILQKAARRRFRWDASHGESPQAFFARVDPAPGGIINMAVRLPTFPAGSPASPSGLWTTRPGEPVWERVNAMSAYQNTLLPPTAAIAPALAARGAQVFAAAGCGTCHSGAALTDGRIVAAEEISTNPLRATALQAQAKTWDERAIGFGFGQTTPFSGTPKQITFPTAQFDPAQVKRAFGWDGQGGYKTPSLIGLAWSAPYLHDGGVAVGPHGELGVAETLARGIVPDARASLRALVDRQLRLRVMDANRAAPGLAGIGITGQGHAFWIDAAAGFSAEDQESAIAYLMTYRPPPDAADPRPAPSSPALCEARTGQP